MSAISEESTSGRNTESVNLVEVYSACYGLLQMVIGFFRKAIFFLPRAHQMLAALAAVTAFEVHSLFCWLWRPAGESVQNYGNASDPKDDEIKIKSENVNPCKK